MPTYNFKNKKTKKQYQLEMTIGELDGYLAKNKNVEQLPPNVVNIADPVRIGVTRPPIDFQRGVLERIKAKVPGAKVENRWVIPKEV